MGAGGLVIIVVGLAVVIIVILGLVASMFRKVGPNQALIIYGFGGTKVVVGGGSVIWPMVQQARELSLELMSFDVTPANSFYTSQGVAVVVEAVAQIKVKSDQVSILTASEQFLNKQPAERESLIRLVIEGHLRGIIGQLTVEQIVKEPEMVAEKVRSQVADDMSKMGLEVVSFTIREIRDENEYILNMGRPDIAGGQAAGGHRHRRGGARHRDQARPGRCAKRGSRRRWPIRKRHCRDRQPDEAVGSRSRS